MTTKTSFPEEGADYQRVLEDLERISAGDAEWRQARLWGLVYRNTAGHDAFIAQVNERFMHTNAINSKAFPSLLRLENEVVSMVKELFHPGAEVCGNLTSGGTESNLLALKAYRDWARVHRPHVNAPEIVIPETAHQSFFQGASYFDLKPVLVPVSKEYVADLDAVRSACTHNTILVVASAPTMFCGTMDPVEAMADLALACGAGLHVDAGIGGLFLAILARRRPVPRFDFSIPGVTSLSLALHKYGFSAKGVGVTLYRSRQLRRHQFFVDATPSRGIHFSAGLLGTRSGGPIASAWASIRALGYRGFEQMVDGTMRARDKLLDGIRSIPGLWLVGDPVMTVVSFASSEISIDSLVRRMGERGWYLGKQLNPSSIKLTVMPVHEEVLDGFIADLRESVEQERKNPAPPSEPRLPFVYDLPVEVTGGGAGEQLVLDLIDQLYS